MNSKNPPFDYLRLAQLDDEGEPVLDPGEGARQHRGVWYVTDDAITLEHSSTTPRLKPGACD